MLDSGAEGPGFKSQLRCCWVTVLGKLFTPIDAPVHQAAKLVAALLRVVGVTEGLTESNGSLPPRTGISSETLRSVIEYGLPFYNKIEKTYMGELTSQDGHVVGITCPYDH